MTGVFEVLAADEEDVRIASRKALLLAEQRVSKRLGSWLATPKTAQDYEAVYTYSKDQFETIVREACEEVGHENAEAITNTLKAHYRPRVAELGPGHGGGPHGDCPTCHGEGGDWVTDWEEPHEGPMWQPCPDCGGRAPSHDPYKYGYPGAPGEDEAIEQERHDADLLQHQYENESRRGSVREARRPRMCPYHNEVVDISIGSGEPQAGYNAMAQHAWGTNHCQGGEYAGGKCNFKREMVTQSFWDDRQKNLDEKRELRQEQTGEVPLPMQEALPEDTIDQDISEPQGESFDNADIESPIELNPIPDSTMALAASVQDVVPLKEERDEVPDRVSASPKGQEYNPSNQRDESGKQVPCPSCGGDGKTANNKECPKCQGKGHVNDWGPSTLDAIDSKVAWEEPSEEYSGEEQRGAPSLPDPQHSHLQALYQHAEKHLSPEAFGYIQSMEPESHVFHGEEEHGYNDPEEFHDIVNHIGGRDLGEKIHHWEKHLANPEYYQGDWGGALDSRHQQQQEERAERGMEERFRGGKTAANPRYEMALRAAEQAGPDPEAKIQAMEAMGLARGEAGELLAQPELAGGPTYQEPMGRHEWEPEQISPRDPEQIPYVGDNSNFHAKVAAGAQENTGLKGPSPKMDKAKWTPQNVKEYKEESTRWPTENKDPVEPIKAVNDDELKEIGEKTTERVELDTAGDESSGFGTGGEEKGDKTKTFPKGKKEVDPVTKESISNRLAAWGDEFIDPNEELGPETDPGPQSPDNLIDEHASGLHYHHPRPECPSCIGVAANNELPPHHPDHPGWDPPRGY